MFIESVMPSSHLSLCRPPSPPAPNPSQRGEDKDSALLSSRDEGLLEPPEWPQGSPASSSVWREDPGLLSRPCRKRRPGRSTIPALSPQTGTGGVGDGGGSRRLLQRGVPEHPMEHLSKPFSPASSEGGQGSPEKPGQERQSGKIPSQKRKDK